MDSCSVDGCERKARPQGMCHLHDRAEQRSGKPDGNDLIAETRALCAAAGCNLPIYARDHCERHYRQMLRPGQVKPDQAPKVCAVPNCERKAVTRGWCHGHYVRWSRTGDVREADPLVRPQRDVCSMDDCERGSHSHGFCRAHARRYERYGDPATGGPIRVMAGDGSISHGYWNVVVRPWQRPLVPHGRRTELEHRLVMATMIQRPLLPEGTVHHKNGDRLDNRPENLEFWNTAQPKGQRIEDKLAYARRIIELYDPVVVRALGWDLDPETGHPY